MKTFQQIGTEAGALVEQKNAAYGSSFSKCGQYMRLLFPDGIRPEQYLDVLLLARDFDKSMRIANHRDAFGENPYADKIGYAILGSHLHQRNPEDSTTWQGNANGPDAISSSGNEQPGSAAPTANVETAPSAIATTVPEPSPQPDGCCEPFPAATAATATEPANPNAAGQLANLPELLLEVICEDEAVWISRKDLQWNDRVPGSIGITDVEFAVTKLLRLQLVKEKGMSASANWSVRATDLGRATSLANRLAKGVLS